MTGPIPPPSKLAEMGYFDNAPQPTSAQIEAANALADWHQEWAAEQVSQGVDGPVPDGRPDPSDYNLHVPDVAASGEAQDAFDRRAREIMGIAPAT